jgi:hypothetical protein
MGLLNVSVMGMIQTFAGIAFDNEIRGVLVVMTGVGVLMGSVWLLLVTNTGTRLGSLIALAGLFGWFAIMGLSWWIYGIGWQGDRPSWEIEEINYGDVGQASIGEASLLPPPESLPAAIDLVRQFGDDAVRAELDTVDADEIALDKTEKNDQLADDDPRKLSDAAVAEAIATSIQNREERNETLTLSELAAVSPAVIEAAEDAGLLDLGEWDLVNSARAGEAQATADAVLQEQGIFESSSRYVVLDTFERGGKDRRTDNSQWGRVKHKLESIFVQFTHPTHYTVVQVQAALDQPLVPGEATPAPVVDETQPVISVIMVRNLGSLRLKPALFTIASTLIFLALCGVLHQRDREYRRRVEEFEAGGVGGG